MRYSSKGKTRRLLCVLFLRLGPVSACPGQTGRCVAVAVGPFPPPPVWGKAGGGFRRPPNHTPDQKTNNKGNDNTDNSLPNQPKKRAHRTTIDTKPPNTRHPT